MKIRTDFVTNSSSSSFVVYTIKNEGNAEKFEKLKDFINNIMEKYGENYLCPSGDDGIYVQEESISVTVFQPAPFDTAVAALIGKEIERMYMFWIDEDSNIPLLDENGNISERIPTDITPEEAAELRELVSGMNITEEYKELSTD